jgi:hypothetical protein
VERGSRITIVNRNAPHTFTIDGQGIDVINQPVNPGRLPHGTPPGPMLRGRNGQDARAGAQAPFDR